MTRRILSLVPLLLTLVFIVTCLLLERSNLPPECNPELEGLLLTADVFPTGWSRGEPVQDDEFREGAIDSCLVSFYVFNGSAGQIVNEYRNEAEAIRGYENLVDYFSWEKGARPLSTPAYASRTADSSFLECAVPRDTLMCQFLARYGRFVLIFDTHFRPEFMTEQDLVRILQAIDARMAHYLD